MAHLEHSDAIWRSDSTHPHGVEQRRIPAIAHRWLGDDEGRSGSPERGHEGQRLFRWPESTGHRRIEPSFLTGRNPADEMLDIIGEHTNPITESMATYHPFEEVRSLRSTVDEGQREIRTCLRDHQTR